MVTTRQDYKKEIDIINPKTDRIQELLDRYYNSDVQICPWRSHLATISWKETEGEPLHIRRAKLFAKICDEIPIAIFDNELVVGSQTHYTRGVGLQLDFSAKTGLEVAEGDRRLRAEQTAGLLSDDDLKILIEDTHYWKDRAPGEVMLREIRNVMGPIFEDIAVDVCTRSYGRLTLYSPDADFEMLLRKGLKGIIADIDAELESLQFCSPQDGKKYIFLQAAKICCEAQIRLAKRYSQLARKMAASETNNERKKELAIIADVCEYVPENPSRNFWEALQSTRFIHLGLYLEDGNGSGVSLGRLDQYLYPFYIADIKHNKLDRLKATELLAAFWIKVAATDSIQPSGIKISGAGYLNTRAILGGLNRSGQDSCNELTYLILHIAGLMKLGIPLYLRWHSGISRDILLKAIWTNIQIGSEPAFHNDEQTIAGLVEDGASLEDARDYHLAGCSHPFPYGSVYGSYHFLNGAKVLELVMNNGYDPHAQKLLGIQTGDPRQFKSIEDWINAFCKQWDYIYDIIIKGSNIGELVQMQLYSQPFASALTPDCIKKGLDVHEGGGRYLQFSGDFYTKVYADTADSLTAINELVYKKQKVSINELLEACATNFDGKKGEYIQDFLKTAPKYGNDLGEPEEMYRRLNDHVCAHGRACKGPFGFTKRDTKLGGAVHSSMGRIVGALPNGRKAGMPLTDGGISPSAGCDTCGPTTTLRSVAKAIDYGTNRSTVLNQKMPKNMLNTDKKINLLIDLIETFFKDYNGYQIQWNIENKDVYLAAKANPSEYKNLIVRVGGFSAYFIELDPLLQDEIIARTEQSLN